MRPFLLGLLALPALVPLVYLLSLRFRLRRTLPPSRRARVAWALVSSLLLDAGRPDLVGRTSSQVVGALVLPPDAAAALGRLATGFDRAVYAPVFVPGRSSVLGDVLVLRRALLRALPPSRRLRAVLAPSGLSPRRRSSAAPGSSALSALRPT